MKSGTSASSAVALSDAKVQELRATAGTGAKRGTSALLALISALAFAGGDTSAFVPAGNHNVSTWADLVTAAAAATSGQTIRITDRAVITQTAQLVLKEGVSIKAGGGVIWVSNYAPTNNTSPDQALILMSSSSEGTAGNQTIENIAFLGNNYQAAGAIYVRGRSGVKIKNCTAHEFNYNFVTFNGRANETDGAATTKATGNGVYNCASTGCCTWIGAKPGGYASGIVQWGSQIGFELRDSVIIAKGRGSTNNGYGTKLYRLGYNELTLIENCTIRKDVDDGTPSNFGFCIETWNDYALTIRGCTLEGWPDVNGATKGPYTFGFKFENNICGTGTTPTLAGTAAVCGVELECGSNSGGVPCSDVFITGNVFRAVVFGVYIYQKSGTGTQKFTNVVIANNVFIDTRVNETITADAEGGTQGWRVVRNTVRKTSSGPYMYAGVKIPHRGTNTDWLIERNAFDGGAVGPVVQEAPEGGTTSNVTIRDNLFANTGNSGVPLFATAPSSYTTARNKVGSFAWDPADPLGFRHAYTGTVGADEFQGVIA